MIGEICPKIEFNPPLQLGTEEYINIFFENNVFSSVSENQINLCDQGMAFFQNMFDAFCEF